MEQHRPHAAQSHRQRKKTRANTDPLLPAHRKPAQNPTGNRVEPRRRTSDDTTQKRLVHTHLRLPKLHKRMSQGRHQNISVRSRHAAQQNRGYRRRLLLYRQRKHRFPQL